jgi:hypothetical protein
MRAGQPRGSIVSATPGPTASPAAGATRISEPTPDPERPPLPQRREQESHLRPELRQAPVLTRPIPGHSPNLLADLQLGRVAGMQEIANDSASSTPQDGGDEQPMNERDSEGDKGPWPTI